MKLEDLAAISGGMPNGGLLSRLRRPQTAAYDDRPPGRSRLIRRGERLEYTVELQGKRSTAQRSADSLFLVGPTAVPCVQGHWEALVAGKTLRFPYGVLDQRGRREQEIRAILGRSLVVERPDGNVRPVDTELVIEDRLSGADGTP